MGFLSKENPKATIKSVAWRAIRYAAIGACAFFLLFKPSYRDVWPIALPVWMLLCAFVGAAIEWQVDPDAE